MSFRQFPGLRVPLGCLFGRNYLPSRCFTPCIPPVYPLYAPCMHAQKYELYASEVLLAEVSRDPNPEHRQKLLEVLERSPIALLPTNRRADVERLAEMYMARRALPASKRDDA